MGNSAIVEDCSAAMTGEDVEGEEEFWGLKEPNRTKESIDREIKSLEEEVDQYSGKLRNIKLSFRDLNERKNANEEGIEILREEQELIRTQKETEFLHTQTQKKIEKLKDERYILFGQREDLSFLSNKFDDNPRSYKEEISFSNSTETVPEEWEPIEELERDSENDTFAKNDGVNKNHHIRVGNIDSDDYSGEIEKEDEDEDEEEEEEEDEDEKLVFNELSETTKEEILLKSVIQKLGKDQFSELVNLPDEEFEKVEGKLGEHDDSELIDPEF